MLAAALLATAAVATAHPAQVAPAPAPVCHGQYAPAPPDPDADVKEYMRQRAEFGFRADAAYVRLLIKRGVWEYDVGYIPVTPAENRYLKLRDDLELGARAEHYLNRHRDIDGGVSVEDDWPREPYLLVRLTRDRKRYEQALRALARYPHNLRTRLVRNSYHRLLQVQKRIGDDDKALAAAGFFVEETGPDIDANQVEVGVITRRADAAAYFTKHYGPVKTVVIATERTYEGCTAAGDYQIAPDGRSLVVAWSAEGTFARIELDEQPDRVTVGVVEVKDSSGYSNLLLIGNSQPVALSAPLGDRPVFDAATGKRLIQRGPSPGEPACPVAAQPPRLSRLDRAIQTRRDLGLLAGRAYVRKRLRAKTFYTAREQRWLDLKEKLEDQPRVDAYLTKHHGEYGGETIEGRYPATPYLLVRVTSRRALHQARLRRLTKYPIRVVTVAHTVTELEALARRIEADAHLSDNFLDGYGDAGFFLLEATRDEQTNTVTVLVITARADAQPYFQGRYGPSVRVTVAGTRFEC